MSQSAGQKLTPFHKEGDAAFFVADIDKLFDIDFSECQTVFVNLVDVSTLHLYKLLHQFTCPHKVDGYMTPSPVHACIVV